MKITKGQHLHIVHTRKGEFDAVATKDFDTEIDEWYPITVAMHNPIIEGMANNWVPGEEIPCRNSQCTIIIKE